MSTLPNTQNASKPLPFSNQGMGMIMSLISLSVLVLLSTIVYIGTKTLLKESVYQKRLAQAHYIAEAGIEEALYQIYLNNSWNAGFTNKPFAGGSYTVKVSNCGGSCSPPWIQATGYSTPIALFGSAKKTIRVRATFLSSHVSRESGSWCASPFCRPPFIRGDANSDAQVTSADVTFINAYVNLGGPAPSCLKTADTNDDGIVDDSDKVYLNDFISSGGPSPPPPYPNIGRDPTFDNLSCASYPKF